MDLSNLFFQTEIKKDEYIIIKVYDNDNNIISKAYVSIYLMNNDSFDSKFNDLTNCINAADNRKIKGEKNLNDINKYNTVYLEFISNGNIKGLGAVFFKIIKEELPKINSNYKYIFLYPSGGLTKESVQSQLIGYYEKIGFIKLNVCDNLSLIKSLEEKKIKFENFAKEFNTNIKKNLWDNNSDYYLLIAKISELNVDHVIYGEVKFKLSGGNYYEKYLKYKAKYLKLKNLIN
jgi:hypothetical protein